MARLKRCDKILARRRYRVGRRVMGRYAAGAAQSGASGLRMGVTVPRLKEGGGQPVVPMAVKRCARRGAQLSFPTRQAVKGSLSGPGEEQPGECERAMRTSAVDMVAAPAAKARCEGKVRNSHAQCQHEGRQGQEIGQGGWKKGGH